MGCASTDIKSTYTSAITKIKGEYYLDSEKYDKGVSEFELMLKENPENAAIHYYLGRFYLSTDRPLRAETALKKAIGLNSHNAEYHFWLGIAYSANTKPMYERKSYMKAISINKKHVQSLVYLGHNLYDSKEYLGALKNYDDALQLSPEIPSALFNRAMILRKLKRKPEEITAWKSYLEIYRSGVFARKAVLYLNAYGEYQYRTYRIGPRLVTIKTIEFTNSAIELNRESKTSIEYIGKLFKDTPNLTLHIVSFQLSNSSMAEKKAKTIKAYLAKKYPSVPLKESR
jgi:tetratricopeptide (TPR) repeat protein